MRTVTSHAFAANLTDDRAGRAPVASSEADIRGILKIDRSLNNTGI